MILSIASTAMEVVPLESLSAKKNTILNREQAFIRLQKLNPGSDEYCKLQDALVRRIGAIVEISLETEAYKIDSSKKDHLLLGGFGPSEHIAIGKKHSIERVIC